MSTAGEKLSSRIFGRIAKAGVAWSALVLVSGLSSFMFCRITCAQELACSLGKITERMPPQYPLQLQGRPLQGEVSVLAAFAPDGRVSSSKVISGPQPLRSEAQAFLSGWRAEPSSSPRQCVIHIEYRFDGSQAVCPSHRDVSIREQRMNDTTVILHLSCDTF